MIDAVPPVIEDGEIVLSDNAGVCEDGEEIVNAANTLTI